MSKINKLFISMFKIGLIGFGGGNALIPVIEKTVVDENKLVSKDDMDVDVMAASITPGALPVEIAGGIGRRLMGNYGLLLGAIAMALPGVILTVGLTSVMSNVNENFVKQIGFLAIGIYAFICSLLKEYILGTINAAKKDNNSIHCVLVIAGVVILVCGKNLFRILPGEISPFLALSTIEVFAMAFFVIFYTRCRFNKLNVAVSSLLCIVFVLCHCKASIITDAIIKYILYTIMIFLSLYGIGCDFRAGEKIESTDAFKNTIKEITVCILFAIVFSLPALIVTKNTISFAGHGFLSSIMSFGGGDAYLTVADGMFVSTGMITESEFYSRLVPLVNVLPGSILCKTLSGVGYYIGLNESGNVFGGMLVAISGFVVSVASSCGVFSAVAGLYDKFGNLNIFQIIKKWIRPIVSGLLINVILSLLVQVKKQESVFNHIIVPFLIVLVIFVVDEIMCHKLKYKNGRVALISSILALVMCNIFGV